MQAYALDVGRGPLAVARQVLDGFGVAARLQHVRQFVWRGGSLRLEAFDSQAEPEAGTEAETKTKTGSHLSYVLRACWPDAVLHGTASPALVAVRATAIDGRWTRGEAGYLLRAGIDLAVPSAIAIRSDRHASFIPFHGRPAAEVERALDADLAGYVQQFLTTCPTVPQATAAGAARLKRLGL